MWLNPLAIRAEYRILQPRRRRAAHGRRRAAGFRRSVHQRQYGSLCRGREAEHGPDGLEAASSSPTHAAGERKTGLKEPAAGPRVTVAREADRCARREKQSPSAHAAGRWHARSRPITRSRHRTPSSLQARTIAGTAEGQTVQDMFTRELQAFIGQTPANSQESTDARIELHRRFALPVACLMLALVGIPLGTSSRKGGRSAGYVWAHLPCVLLLLPRATSRSPVWRVRIPCASKWRRGCPMPLFGSRASS